MRKYPPPLPMYSLYDREMYGPIGGGGGGGDGVEGGWDGGEGGGMGGRGLA